MTLSARIGPGDWIDLGPDRNVPAVVCTIRPGRMEVVYLNEHYQAVHEEACWHRGHWRLVEGCGGAPADKNKRLAPYVKILRAGRGEQDHGAD